MQYDKRQPIRKFGGKIVGYIETNSKTGESQARDFFGKILGFYDPNWGKDGCTRDFYGKIIGEGNQLQGLIWNPDYNKSLQY